MLGVELHRSWWSAKTEFCTRLATDCNLPDQWSKLHGIFEMEQLYFSLTSTALFTFVLVNSTLNYLFQVESLRVFLLLWKGSTQYFSLQLLCIISGHAKSWIDIWKHHRLESGQLRGLQMSLERMMLLLNLVFLSFAFVDIYS